MRKSSRGSRDSRLFVLGALALSFAACATGCTSMPQDYSALTNESFLRSMANNNKPLLIPAKYTIDSLDDGTAMIATYYNIVGAYQSGKIIVPMVASEKLCDDRAQTVLTRAVIEGRDILLCGVNNQPTFLAIHFVSKEPAGSDTGHVFAFFDHIALFDLVNGLDTSNLEWVADRYTSFEWESVDHQHALDYRSIDSATIVAVLTAFAEITAAR